MQSPEQDWRFWQWLAGIAVAVIGGLLGGGWAARGLLEDLRKDAAEHKRRLDDHQARLDALKAERAEWRAEMRQAMADVVQQAIGGAELRHAEQLHAISKSLAVVTALHDETRADVREIFTRLNARKKIIPVENERRATRDDTT